MSSETKAKWGSLKLQKLPLDVDISRLKQARPIIADDPLLPSMLCGNREPIPSNNNKK